MRAGIHLHNAEGGSTSTAESTGLLVGRNTALGRRFTIHAVSFLYVPMRESRFLQALLAIITNEYQWTGLLRLQHHLFVFRHRPSVRTVDAAVFSSRYCFITHHPPAVGVHSRRSGAWMQPRPRGALGVRQRGGSYSAQLTKPAVVFENIMHITRQACKQRKGKGEEPRRGPGPVHSHRGYGPKTTASLNPVAPPPWPRRGWRGERERRAALWMSAPTLLPCINKTTSGLSSPMRDGRCSAANRSPMSSGSAGVRRSADPLSLIRPAGP